MKTVTLNIKNDNDYPFLLQLVNRLGIDIADVPKEKEMRKEKTKRMNGLYKLIDSVKKNELFKEIKNPVQWQKKLRNEWR